MYAVPIAVYIESGSKRVFACALDWPGWCRSGKNAEQALVALAAYAPRYAVVAREADLPFPSTGAMTFDVVQRLKGSASTDFGAPGAIPDRDREPLKGKEADRIARVVLASWTVFGRVAKGAPAELRKGPRGGGRDRDVMVEHVIGAEASYARKLGIRHPQPAAGDTAALSALRRDIVAVLRGTTKTELPEKPWPPAYVARRMAWHVLDHAWEMEDRSA